MKNKLYITVLATCLLIALGSVSHAQPGLPDIEEAGGTLQTAEDINAEEGTSTISLLRTNDSRLSESLNFTRNLAAPPLTGCGNGIFEENDFGMPEECEFDPETHEVLTEGSRASGEVSVCPPDQTCNEITCLCDLPSPVCGDGRMDVPEGEQCEAINDDGMVLPETSIKGMCEKNLTHSNPPWTEPIPTPESRTWTCIDCLCKTCGNGVVDADYDEQCEKDSDCQDGGTCVDCKCLTEPPVIQEVPSPQCIVTVSGFSRPSVEAEANKYNAIVEEILGFRYDMFGEQIYSTWTAQMRFYDAAVSTEVQLDPALEAKMIKSGSIKSAPFAAFLFNGGFLTNLAEKVFRPMPDEHVMKPVLIFPRGSVTDVTMAKSTAGEDIPIAMPDLSASGFEYDTDLSSWGGVNMNVSSPLEWNMNDAIEMKVVPHVPSKAGEVAPVEVVAKALFRPAPASFLGGGDQNFMDPEEVIERLKKVKAEWDAAGRKIDCNITAALTGLRYAPTMRTTMMFSFGGIDLNTLRETQPRSIAIGLFALRGEAAEGGGGCSLTAVQAHAPQLAIILGTVLGSVAGILVVRRRKK